MQLFINMDVIYWRHIKRHPVHNQEVATYHYNNMTEGQTAPESFSITRLSSTNGNNFSLWCSRIHICQQQHDFPSWGTANRRVQQTLVAGNGRMYHARISRGCAQSGPRVLAADPWIGLSLATHSRWILGSLKASSHLWVHCHCSYYMVSVLSLWCHTVHIPVRKRFFQENIAL